MGFDGKTHWRMLTGSVLAASVLLSGCAQPELVSVDELEISIPELPSEAQIDAAETAYNSGRFGDAQSAFSEILLREPGNARATLGLADTLYQIDDYDGARKQYNAAIDKKFPKKLLARAHLGIGLIALREGKSSSARSALEKSVNTDGNLWRGWLALGQLHFEAKREKLAETAYKNAESAGARQAVVHNEIGMWRLEKKEPEKAIASFERALKLDQTLDVARGNIRLAYASTGDYQSAIRGTPAEDLPEVLSNVGYIAIVNGDFETAQKLLERAMSSSPYFNSSAAANLDLLRDLQTSAVVTGP